SRADDAALQLREGGHVMHAVRIHQFGDESVLRYEPVPDPIAGPGQVRIAVKAVSINRGDLARRTGSYPGQVVFPLTLGWEIAGDIEAVGDGVSQERVGQRVLAIGTNGGYAERFVTAELAAVPIPNGLEYDGAAAVPVGFLTAWYGLITTARVQAGERVLIHAGASGVGMAAIQIAKHHGARVISTVGSAAKAEFAQRLGADATINYSERDFVEETWRITNGAGVDVVLESVGGETFEESLDVLRTGGRLVTVGNTGGKTASIDPSVLIRGNLSVYGLYLGAWIMSGAAWAVVNESM